ncbi:MAG: acyl dehydratase [Aeromicrobium sp.]|nr:acyl dehydratase [Aeromicrobium sp.]
MSAIITSVLPGDEVHISVDPTTEPFWEAAKHRQLVAPQCADCGTFRLPPTPFCPSCQSRNLDYPELSGSATVFSFSIVRGYPGHPELILAPAVVDLEGAPGARLVTNIVGVDPDEIHIDMALEVDYSPIVDGWLLPVFRPAVAPS